MFNHKKLDLSLPVLLAAILLASVMLALQVTDARSQDSDESQIEQTKAAAAEAAGPAEEVPLQGLVESVVYPLFLGVDDTTVPAYTMDPATNISTTAFSGAQVYGAAYDPASRVVYFNSGGTLYEWPLDGAPAMLGTVVDGGAATQVMVGLAFHDGQLYGTKNIANEAIWTIDTNTLVANVHIDYVDADYDFGGFAVDPMTGIFYGTNDDTTPHGSGLFQIHPDGSATQIAPYPVGQSDIDGLAISDDGHAYLITDEPGFIYVYDLIGGAYEAPLQNPWTTPEVFSAGAYITGLADQVVCSAPGLAIPDNNPAGVSDSLSYQGNVTLTDLNVSLSTSHTWVGDLVYTLTHQNTGTQAVIYDRPGVPGSTFGCSGNNIAATIDDEGTDGDVESTCLVDPAIEGSLVGGDPPDTTLLSAFDGENLAGTWTLQVSDNAGGDLGTLDAWCLFAEGGLPSIEIDPTTLSRLQPQDTQTLQQLTISNTGAVTLEWSIEEALSLAALNYQPAPDYVAGAHAPSAGAVPAEDAGGAVSLAPPSDLVAQLGPTVRSWNSQNGPYFTNFNLNTPEIIPYVAAFPGTGAFIGAGEYIDGLSYMVDAANNLFVVDDSGTIVDQYMATAPPGGEAYSGMALDPTTGDVYASSTNVATSSLFTFDPQSGTAVLVGPIGGSPAHVALSFDGAGNLFGYDIVSDNFMQIDPATGNTSNVVPLPFDTNFGQGMFFEPSTGLIHMLAFNNGMFQSELWTVNTSNPAAPVFGFVGVLGATYPGGLNQLSWGGTEICDVTDLPWASVNPTGALIPAGDSSNVDVTFDAAGLATGTYTGTLCVQSNDPYRPLLRLPLTMTVAPPPSVVLTKTVGLDPAICASGDTLEVISGAGGVEVTYCYSVQNTGVFTLSNHDLVDDQLGTILSGFAYDLAPGASVWVTSTALLTEDTLNTATWTATGSLGPAASDSDTANVTVDHELFLPIIFKAPAAVTAAPPSPTTFAPAVTIGLLLMVAAVRRRR